MLHEDEDHKGRFERCKQFFVEVSGRTGSGAGSSAAELFVKELMAFLFDTWSAIRIECSKQLARILSSLPKEVLVGLTALLVEAVAKPEAHSWQELHGTVEGIKAILPLMDHNQLDAVVEGCLGLIGHVSIPVRESSSDALSALYSLQADKNGFMQRIMLRIDGLICDKDRDHDEAATLTLDGCLSSVANIFTQMHKQTASDDVNWTQLADIIKKCFYHPASSVRQKAGQVISLLLTNLRPNSSSCAAFQAMLQNALISILEKDDIDNWCAEEVCLMVGDEVLRALLTACLTQPQPSSDLYTLHCTAVLELVSLLQSKLVYYLSHPRFEVRRVMVQALPSLCRACLLWGHACAYRHLLLNEPADRLVYGQQEEEEVDEDAPQHQLLLSAKMAWAGAMIKENRHLVEALHSSCVLPQIFSTSEYWALELQGRLQEVHLRQAFHAQLASALQPADGDQQMKQLTALCAALRYHDDLLLDLLQDILDCFQEAEGDVFLSTDFVEFYPLLRCYLSSIAVRGPWTADDCAYMEEAEWKTLTATVSSLQTLADTSMASLWLQYLAVVRFSNSHSALSTEGSSKRPRSLQRMPVGMNAVEYLMLSLLAGQCSLQGSDGVQWGGGREGVYIPGVMLLPSLTDPSTHPLLHLSTTQDPGLCCTSDDFQLTSPPPPPASLSSSLVTPIKITRIPSGLLSTSPRHTTMPAALHSPQRLSLHSPTSASSHHSHPSHHYSSRNAYAAMDRWHCEAVSPLLCSLAHQSISLAQAMWLTSLAIEWVQSVTLEPLWLDGRHYARKMLLEAVHMLLVFIANSLSCSPSHLVVEVRMVSLYWVRMLGEMLSVKSESIVVDTKGAAPIVKALLAAQCIAVDLHPEIFTRCIIAHSEQISKKGIVLTFSVSNWYVDCVQTLDKVTEHLALLLAQGSTDSEKVSELLLDTLDEDNEEEVVEDDFSDWDEEEASSSDPDLLPCELGGSSTGGAACTYSNHSIRQDGGRKYGKSAQAQAELLRADVEYLHRLMGIWRNRLAHCE